MIRAVLFDFGGVILSSPFEAFAAYEASNGLPPGFIRGLNATNPDTNAWARLERSEVGFDEFATLFEAEAAATGHSLDARAVLAGLRGEIRPAYVTAVQRIREAGLITALLTNNFLGEDREPGAVSPMADILRLFDHVVESSLVGVRKPDPEFYAMALKMVGVPPEETVFLDDLGINLKPAKALGINTIKVVDPAAALADLQAYLPFPLE